ncbi:hypothetical protein B2J93_7740 [Marssonina coronariae]|uniref:Involucrin repeat protein n=1 Tax=Diplocarpon coronariae TaxID=2795749 RepID=A0A218ZIF9_9HELO|nr:hypothetical protein B2J93_7740 [Marssonina coronariae]
MSDRRRTSPEGSSISKRRKQSRSHYDEPRKMRATPQTYQYSSSSSSSTSIVDISRSFPPRRSGIKTFFTAPSERRLRRRRSSRLQKINNSSSSSVSSDQADLAYGKGYIKRPKLRRIRSRNGRDIDRERYAERYNDRHSDRYSDRYSDREGGQGRYSDRARESAGNGSASALGKVGTTAEILAVGEGFRRLAREQNKRDLKEGRNGKKPEAVSVKEEHASRSHSYLDSRGLGHSKKSQEPDEDGWESASDSDSSADSRLAFGNDTQGGWSFFGRKKQKPMSRKSSIVDPRLFGPQNSLNGLVTQPVGYGDVSWTSTSDFGEQRDTYQHGSYPVAPERSYSDSQSQGSLQQVPPVPMSEKDTSEPHHYTSERPPNLPVRPDPAPVQIQHPKPFTPVSQSVYEPIYPARSESGGILKKAPPSSSSRGKSLAEAAMVGVAAAAVGSMISSARDDRKDRHREGESEELERDRLKHRESEKRDKKDRRGSPPREDRKDNRREKEKEKEREKEKEKEEAEARRRDKKRDERRGETRGDKERREKRREERRAAERADEQSESRRAKSEKPGSMTSADPSQYQVARNTFPTPVAESLQGSRRTESVPTVVTVEREPGFARNRSSSTRDQSTFSRSEPRKEQSDPQEEWDEQEQRYRVRDSRDRVLHDAEASFGEARHFTGPYDAAIATAVVAAEQHRENNRETRAEQRRRERKSEVSYDERDSRPRDRAPEADPIQEEANRAYREIVMARKIASEVIRSRTPSPNRSVVHKYDHKENEEQEVIRIVTPPGMEENKRKGLYDAPNADFQLDHVLKHPKDMETFSIPSLSLDRSIPHFNLVRDSDALRPRPVLNLVHPTPESTPVPEKQIARSEPARSSNSDDPNSKRSSTSDVVIGPKGNVVASSTVSAVSKGVTWGENETKHYEVDSPAEHRDELVSSPEICPQEPSRESKPFDAPKASKSWGAIAAGIIGAGVGAAAASEISKSSKTPDTSGSDKKPEAPFEYRGVVVEPESPPRKPRQRSPPSPGPKPIISQSPQPSNNNHMPGAFEDDLDFTATVAAGLQDTGFDPNLVIEDPTFRRRDSPPGSNAHSFYKTPYAETVTDIGRSPSEVSRTRGSESFVIGEDATTPQDWPFVPPPEEDESYKKLSKKDQKKREKATKRQSGDFTPTEESPESKEILPEPESYFEEPFKKSSKKKQKKLDKAQKSRQAEDPPLSSEHSVAAVIVEEPESYFETPKTSKKSKKGSSIYDDSLGDSSLERTVSVPVDAFEDLQNGQDEWVESSKKSKKKSKRDSERYESPVRPTETAAEWEERAARKKAKADSEKLGSPVRSVVPLDNVSELERSSSKQSKRDSERFDSPVRPDFSETTSEPERSASKKSKRDSEMNESPSRSEISSSGKRSKDKSSRRSEAYDYDAAEVALPPSGATSEISSSSRKSKDKSSRRSEQDEYDPTEFSLPPSTPSENSRDGEFEDARSTRRSSARDSGVFNNEDRGDSRFAVSGSASRYDSPERRKKKKSRSGTSDYDDSRSVASAPAGDEYDKKSKKKDTKKSGGLFSGLFGSKSESGVRDVSPKRSKDDFEEIKKKKKSKRSSVPDGGSIYGEIGAYSVNDLSQVGSNGRSNGNGSRSFEKDEPTSDGEKRKKNRSRSASTSSKKDSFLDRAGTLGAGVGIAGVAAAAIAAQHHQQSKADNANSSAAAEQIEIRDSDKPSERAESLDPEIAQWQFRPSIDPQYGDLLPLPPSDPVSPNVEPIDNLPGLPESRPGTPESDRLPRERIKNTVRRNVQDSAKSPSASQVPLKFKMGRRSSIPSSPETSRLSPVQSPANPSQESLVFPRHRARPTSWDSSKEFKPLYLVEKSTRRNSHAQLHEGGEHLPELPPSQPASRSSSQQEYPDSAKNFGSKPGFSRGLEILSIDTALNYSSTVPELLGSGQIETKAGVSKCLDQLTDTVKSPKHARNASQSSSSIREKTSPSLADNAAGIVVATGLVSSIGTLAFTPSSPTSKNLPPDDLRTAKSQESPIELPSSKYQVLPVDSLPPGENQPDPMDTMSKDRSSYLLRSSPTSTKSDDADSFEHSLGCPTAKQKSFDSDVLQSIQESGNDDTVGSAKLPKNVDEHRANTLETLSSSHELVQQPTASGFDHSTEFKDAIMEQDDSASFSKGNKKDRKNDKKGKVLSPSLAQDDLSLPNASEDIFDTAIDHVDSEPADEFSTIRSKKAQKKKDKKKKKSGSAWNGDEVAKQIAEPALEPGESEQLPMDGAIENKLSEPIDHEQKTTEHVDDFSFPKAKGKRDKKGKKKSASFSLDPGASECQPELSQETLPKPTEPQEDHTVSRDTRAVNMDPSVTHAANAIQDPKPGNEDIKPVAVFDYLVTENELAVIDARIAEPDSTAPEVSFPTEDVPSEDSVFSWSKKSKKDKKKSKSVSAWDSDEDVSSLQLQESAPTASPDIVSTPAETGKDEFLNSKFKKKRKKDKQRGKAALSWEDEEPATLQTPEPNTSRDVPVETSVVDIAKFEDFSTSSKKEEKKKKAKFIQLEPDIETQGVQEPFAPAAETSDLARDATPVAETFKEIPSSKSKKKDKKKGNSMSVRDAEDEVIPSEIPATAPEIDLNAEDKTVPIVEPLEEFSSAKGKKDKNKKRKNRSVSSWEPDSAQEPRSEVNPVLVEEPAYTLDKASTPLAIASEEQSDAISVRKTIQDTSENSPETLQTHKEPLFSKTQNLDEHAASLKPESTVPPLQSEAEAGKPDIQDESPADYFSVSSTKFKKKGSSTMNWADEVESSLPATKPDIQLKDESNLEKEAPLAEHSAPAEIKNGKKKKNKSTTNWADEVESSLPETSQKLPLEHDQSLVQDAPPADYFALKDSKKGKKKKNKSAPAWDLDEVTSPVPIPKESEAAYFTPTSSKKKKGKKSQPWNEPETAQAKAPVAVVDTAAIPETTEEIATSSKNGKKKPEKYMPSAIEPSADASTPSDAEKILPASETPDLGPTPTVEPGAWPITPATPVTGGEKPGDEILSSTRKSYFPVVAGALGSAIFEKQFSKDDPSPNKEMSTEATNSMPDVAGESSLEMNLNPHPDGLAAGYDNDQLNLARQLQEEFGKKSSKDKKKRQSLPATPALPSRSRTFDEITEGQPRTRSPSIGETIRPAASVDTPAPDGLEAGYQEDQLSLARQLQAEFGKKSEKKKGKKDKKGRASTLNDEQLGQEFDGPQVTDLAIEEAHQTAETIEAPDSDEPKPDGFAAGYQEDQLSLARQLQADFAKKDKKKDKKHKKSRSTSQTPGEQLPREGYFDDQNQNTSSEIHSRDNSLPMAESSAEVSEATRDGLAVGYNPEQLELARQLKEEFVSGNSRKGKKDKKRRSLLRANTEDEKSSDLVAGDAGFQESFDSPQLGGQDTAPDADPDSVDVPTKKSKDMKGKESESLLNETVNDEDLPEPTTPFKDEDKTAPRASEADVPTAEITTVEPDDEFATVTNKKFKKNDKKSKKRDSLARGTTEDDPSNTLAKETETRSLNPDKKGDIEIAPDEPPAEEDFGTSKKSKEKKKRLKAAASDEPLDQLQSTDQASSTDDPVTSNVTAKDSRAETVEKPLEEVGNSRKSKKDKKKRGSLLQNDSFDIPPEQIIDEQGLSDTETSVQADNIPASPHVEKEQQEFSDFKTSKKSKTNRGSLLRHESFPEQDPQDSELTPQSDNPSARANFVQPATTTPIADEQTDVLGFVTKSSRKDKKKKRGSTFEPVPEQQPEPEDPNILNSGAEDNRVFSPASGGDKTDDGFESTSKKSQNDKMEKERTQQTLDAADDAVKDIETSLKSDLVDDADPKTPTEQSVGPLADSESEQVTNLSQPASQTIDDAPDDSLGDFASTKGKNKKKLKETGKIGAGEIPGYSIPLDSKSEPEAAEGPSLPTEATLENTAPVGDDNDPLEYSEQHEVTEDRILDDVPPVSVPDTVDTPADEWDASPVKISKKKGKKNRKHSSKPDSEGISLPSEPTLEPSKDVPLTPLPAGQTTKDSVMLEPEQLQDQALDPNVTTNREIIKAPIDNWNASFPMTKSNEEKKEQGTSKSDLQAPSGASTPLEPVQESIQLMDASILPGEVAWRIDLAEQPQTIDDPPTPDKEDLQERAEEELGLSSKEKNKKGETSSSSTPFEPTIVEEQNSTTTPASLDEPEDERGAVSAKKSKKDKKKKKSKISTPIEDLTAPVPKSSLAGIEQSDQAPVDVQDTPIVAKDPTGFSNADDDWGAVPVKKKKDKKNKKSGLSTPVEATLPSIPDSHQPIEELSHFPKLTDDHVAIGSQRIPIDTEVPETDKEDDERGPLPVRKEDKENKKVSISIPMEELSATIPDIQPVEESSPPSEPTNFETVAIDADDVVESERGDKEQEIEVSSFPTPIPEPPPSADGNSLEFGQRLPTFTSSDYILTSALPADREIEEVAQDQSEYWNSSSVESKDKKKKKMKGKSGVSIPLEEFASSSEFSLEQTNPESDQSVVKMKTEPSEKPNAQPEDLCAEKIIEETEDSWDAIPKKSKKNKKLGASTPIEEVVSLALSEQLISQPDQQSEKLSHASEVRNLETDHAVEDQDEWSLISGKQSKKDRKKNRKPGLSTPTEQSSPLVVVEQPLSESIPPTEILPATADVQAKDVNTDLAGGAVGMESFSLFKKDKKKKRKSGLSTPINDNLPSVASQEPFLGDMSIQDRSVELTGEANDLASVPSSKKDKKKKNRMSRLSISAEEAPSSIKPEDVHSQAGSEIESGEAEESIQGQINNETKDQDEWNASSAKSKKRDKKNRKSGASTLAMETPPSPAPESSSLSPAGQAEPLTDNVENISQDKTQDVIDSQGGCDSFPAKPKKPQKNEKVMSEISGPVEQILIPVLEQEIVQPEQLTPTTQDLSQGKEEVEATSNYELEIASTLTNEQADEWAPSSKKKSKKGKKKSRLSTPIEEIATPEPVTPILEKKPPAMPETTPVDEPVDIGEWASSSKKKSKKDKRKPGLFSPIEEVTAPEPIAAILEDNLPAMPERTHINEPVDELVDEPIEAILEDNSPALPGAHTDINTTSEVKDPEHQALSTKDLEAADERVQEDSSAFVSNDKKNKISKKSSRAGSESCPSTPSHPSTVLAEPEIPSELLTSDRVASTPVPEQKTEVQDPSPGNLSRNSSKKDKRKRQPTIDVPTGEETQSAPVTSWADEVVEAEVERDIPVIQEIAEDESLSHIAPTVELAPADDVFVRPQKKGKKGTKRNSVSTESTPAKLSSHNFEDTASAIHIPSLATAGEIIAGAALLEQSISSRDESSLSKSGISSATTPTGKPPKKDKEKKNIDRRAPKEDDIFDDPALWEGADPKVHEEAKMGDDDSDGFWSPPEQVEEPITVDEVVIDEEKPPIQRDISLTMPSRQRTPSTTMQPEQCSAESPVATGGGAGSIPGINSVPIDDDVQESLGRPPHQSLDQVDDPFMLSSKEKDKKNSGSSGSRNFEDVTDSQPTVIEAPLSGNISLVQPSRPEHFFTPPRHSENTRSEAILSEPPVKNLSPIPPSRTLHSRIFDLPIVHEENSTVLHFEHHDSRGLQCDEAKRDTPFVAESPVHPQRGSADNHEHVRDSGVHLREYSPTERARTPIRSSGDALARMSSPFVDEDSETVNLHRSPKSTEPTKHPVDQQTSAATKRPKGETATDFHSAPRSTPTNHHDEVTSRESLPPQKNKGEKHTDLHRASANHGTRNAEAQGLVKQRVQRLEAPELVLTPKPKNDKQTVTSSSQSSERSKSERPLQDKYPELTSSPRPRAERPKGKGEIDAGAVIAGATWGFAAARRLSQEQRPDSAQSQRSTASGINRLRTPDFKRPNSATSNRSGTPPLRRSDRKSGDLRSLSQRSKPDLAKDAELATLVNLTSAVNTANPTANEGRARTKDMADVYDGFGEGRIGSPRSPTRPHSMRRRQSMQVLELEQKLEQLAAENRMLAEQKTQADRALHSSEKASSALIEKDAEIDSLKRTLEWLQKEVGRLTEVNDGLTSANHTIARQHGDRYGVLESKHLQTTRELQEMRDAHSSLSAGMEGIVKNEVQNVVGEKDREIARLRAELDAAKEKIRDMQRQILASKANDVEFLTIRDEDYFDDACQKLCQHVQQWVLRFSKFSDMRACRLTSEINNDKTIDRLDNAILDGSDVDSYLADRVKRRDVFMSMTMTMVWEFIFTRYLFGMDREQRQKLKALEKTLSEVGPVAAVHQWRATTLTLLAKREAFHRQREQDTQAVVDAIMGTLSEILPPPSQLEAQIEDQLARVMKAAVDLSVEMRCQRAEYMMLPPLQPEYDANGDLASKVYFNAALMNERSGDTVSNEDLEAQKAVVRIVLFPLVVKKGDDSGEGEEEIVICPAQVLVAKPKGKSVRMEAGNNSKISMAPSTMGGSVS